MTRYDARVRTLAACLSGLAGFVDALAFLNLGGFFVSFMSGNSTRLGVGLAQGSSNAVIAGALVGTFVLGVILGSLTGRFAKPSRRVAVLILVAALLTAGAGLNALGAPAAAIAAAALAMGAENAVFERDGEVSIGLTYMTGTLVKLGQRMTLAILGGDRWAWTPYLFLWLGLIAGGFAGAKAFAALGLGGLWIAAAIAWILTLTAAMMGLDEKTEPGPG
jgi:uncharacterized membrane protein YoaK (UPF0700 family)